MTADLLVALAQLNPVVGDIAGNLQKLKIARETAQRQGAELLITSELFLSGYPPEDLVLRPSFQEDLREALQTLTELTKDGKTAMLVGTPWKEGEKLYNACLLLADGEIKARVLKCDLPNYGPFDEKRVFAAAPLPSPIVFKGYRLGVLICEDMWSSAAAMHLTQQGAQILIVPNGSPYETGKLSQRIKLAQERVAETGISLIYLNQLGGQDELVFDGASFVLNKHGQVTKSLEPWSEEIVTVSLRALDAAPSCDPAAVSAEEADYNALMLGLRDYVTKNRFSGTVLGLSGGIDSALVAVLAVDALGPKGLQAVMLPSPYTSEESLEDAGDVATALGCRYDVIAINPMMKAFENGLEPIFEGTKPDITEENIQARCRGILLMALSNKFGSMVLSTGNKSEMSAGYSTLYGDLCGGFAVLKDVYKTEVYKLARWRNKAKPRTALGPAGHVIPERIFTKAPTAELRPNQKDQDSLPPYEVLDGILFALIEKDLGISEVVSQGYDEELVKRIWAMLLRAEYKRRQGPPGTKITRRHLGRDRRYPITNRYN